MARRDLKAALRVVENIFFYLKSKNVEVFVDEESAKSCRNLEVRSSASTIETLKKADIIITVGGDGTILRAIRRLKPPLRILGVNMGSMGFLCEVEPKEISEAIDKLLAGEYRIQRVHPLSVQIDGVDVDQALNDVLIFTPKPAKVLDFIVKADGIEIFSGRADGALISTNVGSTAYVVSLGGPLVDPDVQCIVTIILNPLKLGVRPFVLPMNSVIQITFPRRSRRGAAIYSDGVLTDIVGSKSIIEVKTSPMHIDFIRIRDLKSTFYRKFYEVRIRGGKEAQQAGA
ncbi:MAG: NAD(+)/NADH kinase [Candidatus Nezhaarchaeales archaeon]